MLENIFSLSSNFGLFTLGEGTRVLAVLFAIAMLTAILAIGMRAAKVGFSTRRSAGWEFGIFPRAIALSPALETSRWLRYPDYKG